MKSMLIIVTGLMGILQAAAQVQTLPQTQYAVTAVPEAPAAINMPATPSAPELLDAPVYQQDGGEQGLTKTFSRTFPASQADKIAVNNQFGSITIRTWDQKEVKADVNITAYSSDADETKELLDGVSIDASKQGDQISFKTRMASTDGNWGSGTRRGKKWRREVKVNYVVYVPATNALALSQQYGNVDVPAFAGPVVAKVQYGNFKALKLNNSNNTINVQYGDMNIQELNNGTLKQQYGKGITLGSANNIKVNAQYSNVSIERLTGDANMSVQYNKVHIGEVTEGAKVVNISAQYAGVDLGFSNGYNGNLDVKTSYGNFKYGDGVSAKSDGEDDRRVSFTKYYTGTIGRGGNNQVSINSSYGTITFR
jgi:hypothetical protein